QNFVGNYQILKRLTPYTIVSPADLKRELEAVAEKGYAVSDQESVIRCRCIAVPVRNVRQKAVVALSISSTPENLCEEKMAQLVSRLLATADRIARETLD